MAEREPPRVARLIHARRVWAIAAVRGDSARLARLHAALETRVWRGDRVVYCGNLIGVGPDVTGTVREALLFRRAVIARPGFEADDVVFLRGAQEEMLHRLLRIQYAPGPAAAVEALRWMAAHGIAPTLEAYGATVAEGLRVAARGPVERAKWTGAITAAIRAAPGHDALLSSLRRAACTVPVDLAGEAPGVLFVAAGLNPDRPFETQGDAFWWDEAGFDRAASGVASGDGEVAPWGGFARLVRGFCSRRDGPRAEGFGLTLDAGSGFGGPLVAACLAPTGEVLEVLEG
jgi:serine/threonine protein phosphatase 1